MSEGERSMWTYPGRTAADREQGSKLPYRAVIVDEAQDMSAEAFRLFVLLSRRARTISSSSVTPTNESTVIGSR